MDGLDISFDAAPPASVLPPNARYQHWDVKKDIPENLIAAFDVIHVRFFAFVLLNDEIPGVIANLFQMLSTFESPTPYSGIVSGVA